MWGPRSFVRILTLSSVVGLGANIICNKIPGLVPSQRTICQRRPDAIVAMGEAYRLSAHHCLEQFKFNRWNCSLINGSNTLYGSDGMQAHKEAAFSNAITAASVSYIITQACSQGNLTSCGCDRSKVEGKMSSDGWKWGGCNADYKHGLNFARQFLDAKEIEESTRTLMNLHNNRAGRKALRSNIGLECKCHGVSGACNIKTCWTTLPPFTKVGASLYKRYNQAKQVIPFRGRRALKPLFLKLKRSKRPHKKPRKSDLVYLEKSPDYCEFDLHLGSLGTRGRVCNRTSRGVDSCELLCCGRGYNTHQITRTWQCNCKFHWCCHVTCDQCSERIEQFTCK